MNSTALNVLIWFGVSAGVLVGFTGAIIGTYFSVKRTNGPRERTFMLRCAVLMWMVLIPWLAALATLPTTWQLPLIISLTVALPFAVRYANRRQRVIRTAEQHRE